MTDHGTINFEGYIFGNLIDPATGEVFKRKMSEFEVLEFISDAMKGILLHKTVAADKLNKELATPHPN